MPAIASLEDLKAAQKELLETTDINELKKIFKKYRRIGWKNICKLWLEERTPEQLKGEGD
jgi:CRISPR/Cas system CMR-associated protein Cmr3 (group 5 of RAMP superfamily)